MCVFVLSKLMKMLCRILRKLFNVDAADYMLSICGNDALRELSSPGKSGSFFYLTNDDRYMIKTMKKAETKVSTSIQFLFLKSVYQNIHSFVFFSFETGSYKDASGLLQPCKGM